jgi:inorganic pyrophosphatase
LYRPAFIIRPTATKGAAMAALKSFTDDGWFIGQTQGFFDYRFKLSKVMPEGMTFPYDFGFVPATKAEYGDPLDVLVLTDEALFPGCLVEVKLVGVIEAEQTEKGESKRNDRLVAIATQSLLYSEIRTLEELNPKVLEQSGAFFVNYQRVRDIEVKIRGHGGPQQAHRSWIKLATTKRPPELRKTMRRGQLTSGLSLNSFCGLTCPRRLAGALLRLVGCGSRTGRRLFFCVQQRTEVSNDPG